SLAPARESPVVARPKNQLLRERGMKALFTFGMPLSGHDRARTSPSLARAPDAAQRARSIDPSHPARGCRAIARRLRPAATRRGAAAIPALVAGAEPRDGRTLHPHQSQERIRAGGGRATAAG